jgi:raffinose/stachyose/melibiose transport system substrate-binding protein
MQVPSGDNPADNQAYVGKGDLMWFVHANSKVKDEAIKWLEFMSRPENYAEFVNAVGWLPTQSVEVENAILAEVSQYPIKLAFEQVHIGRATAGEYASAFPQYLTPMGTIETPQELVQRAMADWNAAQ